MWSFGYTDPFVPDGPEDVVKGDSTTFTEAVAGLYDFVENELVHAEMDDKWNIDHFEQVLGEIRTIRDDEVFWSDPDQWEDMSFTDEIGEIEYFITES